VRLKRESFYKIKKEFFNLIYIVIFTVFFFNENLFFRSKFPKKIYRVLKKKILTECFLVSHVIVNMKQAY